MKKKNKIVILQRFGNALELAGIILVLLFAMLLQFVFSELPCPLCLLQRIGFIFIAFGFMLNLKFGFRPSHYAIVILSAVFTSFVALRQIILHVVPGTGTYGSALFGLHLYTWSFVLSNIIIIVTTVLLSIDRQYFLEKQEQEGVFRNTVHGLFVLFILLIVANIVSVFMECGFKACPDDPVRYELIQ